MTTPCDAEYQRFAPNSCHLHHLNAVTKTSSLKFRRRIHTVNTQKPAASLRPNGFRGNHHVLWQLADWPQARGRARQHPAALRQQQRPGHLPVPAAGPHAVAHDGRGAGDRARPQELVHERHRRGATRCGDCQKRRCQPGAVLRQGHQGSHGRHRRADEDHQRPPARSGAAGPAGKILQAARRLPGAAQGDRRAQGRRQCRGGAPRLHPAVRTHHDGLPAIRGRPGGRAACAVRPAVRPKPPVAHRQHVAVGRVHQRGPGPGPAVCGAGHAQHHPAPAPGPASRARGGGAGPERHAPGPLPQR